MDVKNSPCVVCLIFITKCKPFCEYQNSYGHHCPPRARFLLATLKKINKRRKSKGKGVVIAREVNMRLVAQEIKYLKKKYGI